LCIESIGPDFTGEEIMLEDIKKALLAGLGGVVLTRDKLEEWKNRLVKENKMSEGDATRLIDDLIKAGEGQWNDFERTLREMLRKRLDKMNLADQRELEKLQARVEALELRLSALEQNSGTPEKIL
jgi:polyhydroxyalkanoate synthesis regulator phasin